MRRRLPTAAAIVAIAITASAPARAFDAPEVSLHGSFENQLTAMWLRLYEGDDALAMYDYTRLRIDLDAEQDVEVIAGVYSLFQQGNLKHKKLLSLATINLPR